MRACALCGEELVQCVLCAMALDLYSRRTSVRNEACRERSQTLADCLGGVCACGSEDMRAVRSKAVLNCRCMYMCLYGRIERLVSGFVTDHARRRHCCQVWRMTMRQ